MSICRSIVSSLLLVAATCETAHDFPPGFEFGVGTAAYQIEGGWNASDKGESIWDRFTHTYPHLIINEDNGDVACDSYHNWQTDVEMIADIGVDFYRFSISWPRLLPTGFAHYISDDGKKYYNSLINELLKKGIKPMITIYHWDLPQPLQELGGWLNPLIVDWFAEYSRVVFSLYSDRVKSWITINEPFVICDLSHGNFNLAPNTGENEVASYLCTKHVVLAHAKAYRIYENEFKRKHKGKVSIANHVLWIEPISSDDEKIAEVARQLYNGRYTYPIFSKEGGWPPAIEKVIAENSLAEGYVTSKLPLFTSEEIKLARGTYDFFALNQYSGRLIRRVRPGETVNVVIVDGSPELQAVFERHPDWKETGSRVLWIYPEGLRRSLVWLKKQYGDVEIVVTENGYSSKTNKKEDTDRINFLHVYLEQLLLAIKEDGVNVIGYTVWSLMDNFEWGEGYGTMFGLYSVDFNNPTRPRAARQSAFYYANVIKAHSLNVSTSSTATSSGTS